MASSCHKTRVCTCIVQCIIILTSFLVAAVLSGEAVSLVILFYAVNSFENWFRIKNSSDKQALHMVRG
jgi:hypothetical protein